MLALLQDLVSDKKKLVLVGVMAAVFLYVDFTFVIGSQMKGLKTIKDKIVTLRKDIVTLNSDIAYVQNTSRTMVAPLSSKKLPTEKEIPSFMQTISAIANENGIRIMQIDSTKEAPKAEKKGSIKRAKKGAKVAAPQDLTLGLMQVSVKLDIIASYHKLGNFINGLENAEKLCIIDDITINRDAGDPLKQNVSLVVKTYVKK